MAKRKSNKRRKHLMIPDTQIKPGVNTDHIEALGHYIVDQRPDVIVMIGDWWDMASLSSYETKGSKYFHDKNYRSDVQSGVEAMVKLLSPLRALQGKLVAQRKRRYEPRLVFCLGNHEDRITRAVHADPVLEGTLSLADLRLEDMGWEVHPFMEVVEIDGILYSHYFVNQDSLKKTPLGGTIENRLKNIGQSFTMGHQQIRKFGSRYAANNREQIGLVAGAFYSHDEDYLGPQGNNYWRGVVVKHEVEEGSYDPMFVSLRYLVERWKPS